MDRKEFQNWLTANETRIEGYTPEEIADLAIACGFNGRMIAEWYIQTKFHAAA